MFMIGDIPEDVLPSFENFIKESDTKFIRWSKFGFVRLLYPVHRQHFLKHCPLRKCYHFDWSVMDYSFRVICCSVLPNIIVVKCSNRSKYNNWQFLLLYAGLKFHTERFHNLEPSGGKKAKQALHVDTTNPLPAPALAPTPTPTTTPTPTPNRTTAKPQRHARTRKGRERRRLSRSTLPILG
jgi:hypothetical protein